MEDTGKGCKVGLALATSPPVPGVVLAARPLATSPVAVTPPCPPPANTPQVARTVSQPTRLPSGNGSAPHAHASAACESACSATSPCGSQLPPDVLRRVFSFLSLSELLAARAACLSWRAAARSASHVYHRRPVSRRAIGTLGMVFPRASSVRLICARPTKLDQILRAVLIPPVDDIDWSPGSRRLRRRSPPSAAMRRAASEPGSNVRRRLVLAPGGDDSVGSDATVARVPSGGAVSVPAGLLAIRPPAGAASSTPIPGADNRVTAPAAKPPASLGVAFALARPALGDPLDPDSRYRTPERPPRPRRDADHSGRGWPSAEGSFVGSAHWDWRYTPASDASGASQVSASSAVGEPPLRPPLRGLRVTNVRVDEASLALLATVAAPVRRLRLSGRWLVSRPSLQALIARLSRLQSLDLTGCQMLNDGDIEQLLGPEGGDSALTLRKFACDSMRISSPTIDCPNLVSLSLARTKLLAPSISAPKLSWLSLAFCRLLTSEVLYDIVVSLPNLHFLDTRGCGSLKVGCVHAGAFVGFLTIVCAHPGYHHPICFTAFFGHVALHRAPIARSSV